MSKNIKNNLKNYAEYLFLFLLGFLPRFIMSFYAKPLLYISDETSAIYVAAKLAGYNWDSVVSNAGYYGIGYLWIYAPLFKMGLPITTIYSVIFAGGGVLVGLTGIVVNKIIADYFPEICTPKRLIISSFICCASCLYSYNISCRNEEILGLLSALIAYELIAVIKTQKIKNQIFIMVLILYAQFCHERAVIFIFSLVLTAVLYRVIIKQHLLNRFAWYLLTAGYFIIKFLLQIYQSEIWSTTVRNSNAGNSLLNGLKKISLDWIQVKAGLMILFGQFLTAASMTTCIFLIALIGFCFLFCVSLKRKATYENRVLLFTGFYYFIAVFATIAGLIVTWGNGVYAGLKSGDFEWVNKYKSFTYMRYPGPFIIMMLFVGLLIMEYHREWQKKVIIINLFCVIFLEVFWNLVMTPYTREQDIDVFRFYNSFLENTDQNMNWAALTKLLLLFAVFWLFYAYNSKKNLLYALILLAGFNLMGIQIYNFENNNINEEETNFEKCSGGVNLLQEMDNSDLDDTAIYVFDTYDRTNHQIFYLYQLFLYNKVIHPGLPEDFDEECIIFTNQKVNYDLLNGYDYVKIDKNEYMYTNDKEILKAAKELLSEQK